MTNVVQPKSFFLKGGKKTVLLLHSFTGSTAVVKSLERFLNQKNYTCFAPLYNGHGLPAEQLILTTPSEWWESVIKGYEFLMKEGYNNIAVIGISLGGIFALNVGQNLNVNGIVAMFVPSKREQDKLKSRVMQYALTYKQLEGKDKYQVDQELNKLKGFPSDSLLRFTEYIDLMMERLVRIDKPIFILYGEQDETLYRTSADYIYKKVSSNHKTKKGYHNSKHLMTLDEDQREIRNDVLSFLNGLQWTFLMKGRNNRA